ncbi:MAG: rRNA maturation RNase YbeY [Planctomycetota bacterium]|jgi:probable rRNA maturation factor
MAEVVVQIAKNFKDIDVCLPKLEKLVKAICNRFTRNEVRDRRYEISIAVVGDAEIRKVNKQFLNRKYAADCLSFDLSDDDTEEGAKSFELVVNAEMAVKEANLRGHSSEAELALYITHGLLHHLQFDDSEPERAKIMHHTEDEILQQLGYGLVYNKDCDSR